MEKVNDMETMNIKKLAIKISTPMVISMISIALYGIVDTMFISGISGEALTAISLAMPIVAIITAIGLGTGVGVNALLAKTLGEKKEEKSKKIIITGIILTFISWIIVAVIGFFGAKVFFEIFTKNEQIQKLGCEYLSIISIFSIGTLFQILFEKILEAYGKSKLSMIIQFSGAVINLILDPIFIFGFGFIPAFGIKGAAIATVAGQILGMLIGVYFLIKGKLILKSDFSNFKFEKSIIKDIYKVGFPTMILEAVTSFITLILNKILIIFSEAAVSVWGIYCQLQKFVIIIVYGLNNGMIPIIAYNWGAKKKARVKEAIRFFLKLAIGVTAVGALIFLVIPDKLASIYKISSEILNISIPAFRILALGFVFAGISIVLSASFQAFGNGTYSLIINLSRQIIFALPLIFILKSFMGIYAVWTAFAISEVITMLIAIILYKKINKKVIENISEESV
ncbi:MAG: MATE family efflux transporter [Clostridia bacterium]|nr:MATE family efflux transporter [Clostridia bacterium]